MRWRRAGFDVAAWGVDLLLALSPASLPRAHEAGIDGRVLGFTAGLSLAVGLIFGLAPAFEASRVDLNDELKAGGRGAGSSPRRNRIRSLLVVSEVALAVVLVVGAGLFVKSFARLQQVSAGFDSDNLLLARLSLPPTRYSNLAGADVLRAGVRSGIKTCRRRLGRSGERAASERASCAPTYGFRPRALSSSDAPAGQNRWVRPG